MSALLVTFALSLGMTLLFETGAALVYGVRSRYDLLVTGLVNCVTNPLAVLCYLLGRRYAGLEPWLLKLVIEAAVLASEAALFSRYTETVKRPALYAAVLNAASFSLGEIVNLIR